MEAVPFQRVYNQTIKNIQKETSILTWYNRTTEDTVLGVEVAINSRTRHIKAVN
jgi:hypothetical protein